MSDCGETFCRCGECPIPQGSHLTFARPDFLEKAHARYPEGWFTYSPIPGYESEVS